MAGESAKQRLERIAVQFHAALLSNPGWDWDEDGVDCAELAIKNAEALIKQLDATVTGE